MTAFSTHPVNFINAWLDTQARDLKVILAENAIGADEQRRTALFQQPWVKEAAVHYLSDRVCSFRRADTGGPVVFLARTLMCPRASKRVSKFCSACHGQAAERTEAQLRPAHHGQRQQHHG